jgi:hypothetical protein
MSKKISEMDYAAPLEGYEAIPVVQEGVNVQATVSQLWGETYAGVWGPIGESSPSSSGDEFTAFDESLELVNTGAAIYVPAVGGMDYAQLRIMTPGVYRVTMQVVIYTDPAFSRPDTVVYEMGLKGDLTLYVTQGVMHFPSELSTAEGNFIALSGTGFIICSENMWLHPFIRAYVPEATLFNWKFDGGLTLGLERIGPDPGFGG